MADRRRRLEARPPRAIDAVERPVARQREALPLLARVAVVAPEAGVDVVERRRQLADPRAPAGRVAHLAVVGGQRDAERIDAVAERARELLVEAAEEAGQRRVEARRPA